MSQRTDSPDRLIGLSKSTIFSYAKDMSTVARTPSVDAALASALRISVMRLARRMRQQRCETGLTMSQLAALATVERSGPMTPTELAAIERVQPPSMTRIAAALEDRGLFTRTEHPTDGRQSLLAISRSGATLLREERRRRDAWLAQRMRDLPAEDLETLRAAALVLDRLASL